MKTLKILFLSLLTIATISCGEDDGPENLPVNAENIAGTYSLTFFRSQETYNETVNGSSVTRVYLEEGTAFNNAIFVFNANGTYTSSGTYTYDYEEQVNGVVVDTDTDIDSLTSSGTYSVVGNSIYLSDADETFEVQTLTSSNMTLSLDEVDGDSSYELEIRFTKQ
ncbi:hypothetical protein [Nonlabens sp. SY33080]|uniref:hypothetical protein n=1 Tax=Nonlabens sp. SY33080 TaxID=2719911 RepID=UPI001428B29B|nr:hypothetical protein [Nonlabens sp. SY33080]